MGEANSDFGSALDSGKSALVVELRARVAELTATSTELTAKVAKLTATNAELRAQVAELEARLGAPPKTPANSSLPPSRGEKANKPVRGGRRKRKGRAGTGRKLHPHPNSVVEARAEKRWPPIHLGDKGLRFRVWNDISHQIGHAVGLAHEHQRADRDDGGTSCCRPSCPIRCFRRARAGEWLANAHAAQGTQCSGRRCNGPGYDYSSLMHFRSESIETIPPGSRCS